MSAIRDAAAEMRTGEERLLAYRSRGEGLDCELLCRIADGRIAELDARRGDTPKPGDICLARIVRLDPAMRLAYLEIGGVRAFFSLGEPEKIPGVLLVNRTPDGRLHQEDWIVVRVSAEAHGKKPLRVDGRCQLTEAQREAALHKRQTGVLFPGESLYDKALDGLEAQPAARWLTEDAELYQEMRSAAEARGASEDVRARIRLYDDALIPMTNLYGVTAMLDRITREQIWLRSGAQLVITPTEAFTVVDVNSGKRTARRGREEELLAVNLEAAEELVYQIGARRLGGIILADFINMKSAENETILSGKLSAGLAALRPAAKLEDITKLGIAEITRRRRGADIYELKPILNKTILRKK